MYDAGTIGEQIADAGRAARDLQQALRELYADADEERQRHVQDIAYDLVNFSERVAATSAGRGGDDIINEVSELRTLVGAELDEVAKRVRAAHLEGWTKWLRDGVEAGARNAHRYLRLPAHWRPQAVRDPDGILTAEPAAVMEAYRDKYVKRWNGAHGKQAEHQPRSNPPWAQARRCAFPRTDAAALRSTSMAFPRDTAVAFDGIAMRHFAMLTDDGLETLADIILAMELIGRLPPQLNALIMPLLAKDRGGHRAITTASSLYRLWGRLRREATQAWEAAHDRPYFAAGKGRRVHDVVWRQLVRAEAGSGEGKSSIAIAWDMAAFCDTLNRARLWKLVVRHDFPLVIARLAFAAYDAPRALTLEGRMSCPTFARDGVPAGCPFATALSRLYCVDPFDELALEIRDKYPDEAGFDSYVDDLVVTVTADHDRAAQIATEIAESLRAKIEGVMGCEIELSKAAVVASSRRVAASVTRQLGDYAGQDGQRASFVNLGIGFAPARPRTAHRRSTKRRKRYAALARRGRKLCRSRRALGGARRAKKLFTIGLLPAAIHDAAVKGVIDREAL